MPTIPETLAAAVESHRSGRLDAAETQCRQILSADPRQPDALHLLGLIAYQTGRHPLAVDSLRLAVQARPDFADALYDLAAVSCTLGQLGGAIESIRTLVALKAGSPEWTPVLADAHNVLANALMDQGRLAEAVAFYRQGLRLNPDSVALLCNLGNVLNDQGAFDDAAASYRRALELDPNLTAAINNLGNVYQNQGRLADAAACYRRALELAPNFPEAHNNLGNVLIRQGSCDEAVAAYRRAIACKPDYALAHFNLANALQAQGKLDEAIASHRQALLCHPGYTAAHNGLGVALQNQGKLDDAILCFRRALAQSPGDSIALCNLGNALLDQGKLEDSIACYREAIQRDPALPEGHNNLGNALLEQGKIDDAIASLHRALELRPDFASAHNNLGNAFRDRGDLASAIASYQRSLACRPDFPLALSNLGNAFRDAERLEDAVACYRRALELKPDNAPCLASLIHSMQHLCWWDGLDELCRRLLALLDRTDIGPRDSQASSMFLLFPVPTTEKQQYQVARQCARRWSNPAAELPKRPAQQRPKIRIGYLSADFHSHATAYLAAQLFEAHDHDRFEIVAYSYGPDDGSPMRQRLVRAFDRFVDITPLSVLDSARRIHADEIDILVDLKGLTKDARTRILSFRPAPIQVNYLGYPGTMGADFMDYILVDDFVVPPGRQPYYAERLVHLPGSYQVNDRRREASKRTPSRAECGLPPAGFVFCSFNNNYKITPAMFDVWMRLLHAVPGSVLWLLEGNRGVASSLRHEAERRAVSADRLVFAPRLPLADHLARHRNADLFLDSLPCNAHTTASDALWMGLPVLTLAGETFAARVAGSLLRAVGVPELITRSVGEYEALALQLAQTPGLCGEFRARLLAGRETSSLFDGERFARNVEKAYLTMWQIHARGEAPRAFVVEE